MSYIEPKPAYMRKNELSKLEFICECKYCKQEADICDKDAYFKVFDTYVKIQNMMVNNGINSYEQLEIKLDVFSQDTIFNMINNMIEKKVFNWDDINLKFLYFIFFKCIAIVIGHFDNQKNFANFMFEKAYECVK